MSALPLAVEFQLPLVRCVNERKGEVYYPLVWRYGVWAVVEDGCGHCCIVHVPTGSFLGSINNMITSNSDVAIVVCKAVARRWPRIGRKLAFGDWTTPFPQKLYDVMNAARRTVCPDPQN